MTIETLTRRQYLRLAPKVAANQAAMREGPNPRDLRTHPYPFPKVGNKETGLVEQYHLRETKPDVFGAYLSGDEAWVTTWTGDTLGYVIGGLSKWRSNWSDERASFRFKMNGREYAARGPGAGMYCTCRAIKGSKL